jgi:hypothetical protein
MDPRWLSLITVSLSIAGYFLISYAFKTYNIVNEATKIIPYIPMITVIVSALIKWFTEGSLSIKGVVQKAALFQQNTREDRQDYFLNVKRIRGKERPKNCQGRSQIIGKNIEDYSIWRSTRERFSDIGTDDDLLLFEIFVLDNNKNIVFHRKPKTLIEQPYFEFEDSYIIVDIDAENMKPCKPYKKKIADIVEETKKVDGHKITRT